MHGCITGCFKNQIDWIPLNTGSVRPTQGKTAVVLQVWPNCNHLKSIPNHTY
jgi:arsenic resistance protein ArsH